MLYQQVQKLIQKSETIRKNYVGDKICVEALYKCAGINSSLVEGFGTEGRISVGLRGFSE